MASNYPTILQIVPIPATSTKLQHTRAQGIITSLTELGFDSIVCTHPYSKEIDNAKRTLSPKANKTDIETHAELEKLAFSTNLKLLFISIKAYRRNSPIAIHSYGFRGLGIAALTKICFFWKQPTFICDLSEEECSKLSTKSRFSVNALFMKLADVILCSTQDALTSAQETLHLDSTKIALVVDGQNSSDVISDERIEKIRSKLKLDKSKKIIVVNGGLEKRSDQLKELQKVLLSLKEFSDRAHFLITGEPKKYLYHFLKKHDCRSMCSFVGDIPPKLLPQYYSVCDIALTLGRSDNNDNRANVLNFMANSLPVVAFDSQLSKHYLPDETPFAHSTSEIADRVKDLSLSNKLLTELASKNTQRFEEYYSWEVSKEQLHATYLQVLS